MVLANGAVPTYGAVPAAGNRPEGRAPTRAYGPCSGTNHIIGYDEVIAAAGRMNDAPP